MISINIRDCKADVDLVGAYDKCLECPYLRNGCDGPRTTAMSLERWCKWLNDLRLRRRLTIQAVSDGCGIGMRTLMRIFKGTCGPNVGRETCCMLENFLIGSAGQWPCAMELNAEKDVVYMDRPETIESMREKTVQVENLRSNYNDLKASIDNEMERVRAESAAEIERLRGDLAYQRQQMDRKDAVIAHLMEAAK